MFHMYLAAFSTIFIFVEFWNDSPADLIPIRWEIYDKYTNDKKQP